MLAVREVHVARRCDHPVLVERALQRDDVDVGREVLGADVLRELAHLLRPAGADHGFDRGEAEGGEPAIVPSGSVAGAAPSEYSWTREWCAHGVPLALDGSRR